MFLRSSSRPQPVDCFFCLSASLLPPSNDPKGKGKGRMGEVGSKWNWNCERCGCWNVRDERGEIVSELPAMRTPTMNKRSFELRAKPSSSHLPSTTVASPFCHICLTNQTLIMNMLANYLPDEDDPTYPSLYANLPTYLQGVHARYPPVCHACQPAVDDALRRANHRANVDAWGSALRRGSTYPLERRSDFWDVLVWKARGGLFIASAAMSMGIGTGSIICPNLLAILAGRRVGGMQVTTLWIVVNTCSILWMAWDPYWLRRRNRSRTRIMGRRKWLIDMAIIYVLRLAVAGWFQYSSEAFNSISPISLLVLRTALVVEMTLFIHAFTSLKISAPVRTRPIEPLTLSRPASPRINHPSNSHHSTHVTPQQNQSANPIFGLPAFTTHDDDHEPQYEPMDWEPSPTVDRFRRPPGLEDDEPRDEWESFAVNKQRMFASRDGQDETGLESLIAGWGIDPDPSTNHHHHHHHHHNEDRSSDSRNITKNAGQSRSTPSTTQIGELIVRITSSLLTFARIVSLILILSSTINDKAQIIDQVLSGIEVGTIVMSAILLPRQYPSPRIAILACDFILHLVYAVFQRHSQLGETDNGRDPWMVGMTWGQWALLNATRAMI